MGEDDNDESSSENDNEDDVVETQYDQQQKKQKEDQEDQARKRFKEFKESIHPSDYVRHARKYDLSDEEIMEEATTYLEEQAVIQPTCTPRTSSVQLFCSCFSIFHRKPSATTTTTTRTAGTEQQEDPASHSTTKPQTNPVTVAVARYMIYFARLTKHEQQAITMEWIRQGQALEHQASPTHYIAQLGLLYLLPLGDDVNDINNTLEFRSTRICQHALLNILGKGKKFWSTCKKAVEQNITPNSANKNLALLADTNNAVGVDSSSANILKKAEEEIKDALFVFFDSVRDQATPSSTDDTEELPASWNKRDMYIRFCFDRGWKSTVTEKGKIEREERSDEGHVKGNTLPVGTYVGFQRFWNQYYPNLVFPK